MTVELVFVTDKNLRAIANLTLAPGQERFVAPNLWSLAQAYTEQDIAEPRAVVADGDIVGFLMLEIDPDEEDGRPHWLWRLMIDANHQRRGHGRAALDVACSDLRDRGATELFTSWVPGDDGPGGFYLGYGFVPTGEIDDDEIVARLDLTAQR